VLWCVYSSDVPVKSPGSGSLSAVSVIDADASSDDAVSMEGYGDVDVGKYNEDGSFVGAYSIEPTRM